MEMHRLMTLKEFEREWRTALALTASYEPSDSATTDDDSFKRLTTKGEAQDESAAAEDPFDCTSLCIPSTHALISEIVQPFIDEWRELDERKIVDSSDWFVAPQPSISTTEAASTAPESPTNTDNNNNDEDASRPQKMARTKNGKLPKWFTNRVRLPEQFDYACKRPRPPPDDGAGDRVVSLLDPTQTLSYHQELWKLFRSIPTAKLIEKFATQNASLPHMQQWTEHLAAQGTKPTPDCVYAVSRLRYSDRHDAIPTHDPGGRRKDATDLVPTIHFECWRRQLKRGASPDAHRMSIEFLGSQTLLDFHLALVELSNDELWCKELDAEDTLDDSGYFFIEGTFYKHGSVDYVTPIQTWLASGTKAKRRTRVKHLGLTVDATSNSLAFPVQAMADIRLEDVAMRLGFRYVHVHHGDVESSVFCIDRKLGPKTAVPYPILHDIWTPNYILPDCEACQSCPAAIATSTSCETTLGHAAICEGCSRQLGLQIHDPANVEVYNIWRSQGDLSIGATSDKFF